MKSSGELLKSFCCSLMRRQGSHCQADLGFSKHNLAKRIRKLLSCCTMRLWKSCKTKRHRKRCVFLTCLRMTEKLIAAWTDLFLKCMSVIFSRQSLYSMSHWIGLFVQWILYNKTLGPQETSWFCFPSSPDVSLDFVSGNIRTREKTKLTVSLGTIH